MRQRKAPIPNIFKLMAKNGLLALKIGREIPALQFTDQKLSQAFLRVREEMTKEGHETLLFYHHARQNVRAIIAIHNTAAGPALGGCRLWNYKNFNTMFRDALQLSRAMTYKAILAKTGTGGGKMVVWGDPHNPATKVEALFSCIAEALTIVNGDKFRFATGEDVGMSVKDVEQVALYLNPQSQHFLGGRAEYFIHEGRRGGGNSGQATALGIIEGMKAAISFLDNTPPATTTLDRLVVAIQGLGNVGLCLAKNLRAKFPNIDLVASEMRLDPEYTGPKPAELLKAVTDLHIRVVHSRDIDKVTCDIFAPCALGVTLNIKNIKWLRCRIVAGSQNNQLATRRDGERLWKSGIIYLPDYVVNAGGVINISDELSPSGFNGLRVESKIVQIGETIRQILKTAQETKTPPEQVADNIAEYWLRTHTYMH